MKKCWSANPFFRPTAKDVDYVLVELSSKDAEPLETADRKAQEKGRKPTSLYDVFPKHIADALNAGKRVEPESHEIVTVGGYVVFRSCPTIEVSNKASARCGPSGRLFGYCGLYYHQSDLLSNPSLHHVGSLV
jgi:hypothetical protein